MKLRTLIAQIIKESIPTQESTLSGYAPVTEPKPLVKPRKPGEKEPVRKPSRPLTPPKHAPKPGPKAEGLNEEDTLDEESIIDKITQRFKKLS